jgi:flagellar biosynthesis protein FlhF
MRIKRYEGDEKDLPRIIRQVKRDLGENAVVKTRRYKKGGVLGIGAKNMVEIYAGIERDLSSGSRGNMSNAPVSNSELLDRLLPKSTPGNNISSLGPKNTNQQPYIYSQSDLLHETQQSATATTENDSAIQIQFELQKLAREIADIRRSIDGSAIPGKTRAGVEKSRQFPRWLDHLKEKLIANEVDEKIADQMLEETLKASDPETLADFEGTLLAFQKTISSTIVAQGSLKGAQNPRILALAGPTGVGKTTTLAKLAATSNLLDKERVGLISADTYRIAAIDQLKTFAGILDIPLKVVFSPAELREALDEYRDMDRIYLDTAGRSPNHDERMEELRELIAAHNEIDCHLVIAATTRPKDMQLICDRFRPANYSRFIFTKIDETTALGPVLSTMYTEGLPASYLTNGQSVPDDIILGEESDLLGLVLRKSMS